MAIRSFAISAIIFLFGFGASHAKIYEVMISPSGGEYAIVRDYQDQRILQFFSVDDASMPAVNIGLGRMGDDGVYWCDDDYVLVLGSGVREATRTVSGLQDVETQRWLSISRDDGEFKSLFGDVEGGDLYYVVGSAGRLISCAPSKDDVAIFSRLDVERNISRASRINRGGDKLVTSLFEANLKSSRVKRREKGEEDTIDWVTNAADEAIARIDKPADQRLAVFTRPTGKGSFNKVADIDFESSPINNITFFGAASAPGAIQTLVTMDTGERRLQHLDMETGVFAPIDNDPGSVSGVYYDPRSGRAMAATLTGDDGGVFHFDAEDVKTQSQLESALGGATVMIVSKSADGSRLIAKTFKPGGVEYYLFDRNAKSLDLIAQD